MRCKNSNLMGTNDTSIIMENHSLVTFVQHDMTHSVLFCYNTTSWNMSFDSELWVRGAYSNGLFYSSNASFGGTVRIGDCLGLYIILSVVQ